MESGVEQEDTTRSPLADEETGDFNTASTTPSISDTYNTANTCTTAADSSTLTTTCVDQTEEEEGAGLKCVSVVSLCPEDEEDTEEETSAADEEGDAILISSSDKPPAGSPQVLPAAGAGQDCDYHPGGAEDKLISDQDSLTWTRDRPAPPSSLSLSDSQPTKKKILVAPALNLSLGCSESAVSDEFPSAFLSLSPEDDDDTGLDFDLDALETPSDSESLRIPMYDLDLEDDLQRLGVASQCRKVVSSRFDSQAGSGALDQEDVVDNQGIKWRCFSTGDPPQESRVNMSVLEPFLRVLSHGGYYGDGMNDIIVFSSCYLPQNSQENYQYVMDNLFRYVVGTLDLMVAENYVIVYFCAGGQNDKLPGIGWLRECYTTIDRRLRKNLKGFYVVHPTWYIKALITIIKPFISTKFSRKLQFVDSLQDLARLVPTEHVQIPDCVAQYDHNLAR